MMMTRRLALTRLALTRLALSGALAGALGLSVAPRVAQADAIPLARISAYLNAITTAEATFVQINADGSRSKGTVYIRRPGRMRFEYAAPDKSLVMAGAGQVAVFDGKSNQGPQQYPLSRTPLNLILAKQVDLGRAKMVVAHQAEGADTIVVAQDPDHPDYGTLRLVFGPGPVLRQWVVSDTSGGRTQVNLGPLTMGKTYPASYFNIFQEVQKRNR